MTAVKIFFCVASLTLFYAAFPAAASDAAGITPETIGRLGISKGADKLVIAVADGGPPVVVYAFERTGGSWSERVRANGFVGRNGVSRVKKEGDGKTPAGFFSFGAAFGVADDPGSATPYAKLDDGDLWVDDPKSEHYNRWVKRGSTEQDWSSAEDLSKETVAYKYAIAINYNTDPVVKGNGSAIFLHCSTNSPTAGCVSVSEEDMARLLKFIDSG
ncbi:MAG: L,D-transpeptidase family protein, partial [Synergistaceae bacterium]|nr:L,D-transpeptidase family protein [Synergistaceae bacterium]